MYRFAMIKTSYDPIVLAGMVVDLTKNSALVGGIGILAGYWNSTLNREGRAPPCFRFVLNSDNAKAIHFTTVS